MHVQVLFGLADCPRHLDYLCCGAFSVTHALVSNSTMVQGEARGGSEEEQSGTSPAGPG